MSDDNIVRISHFGICARNLEQATRFYVEALGFEPEYQVEVAPPFQKLVEQTDIKGRAQFLRRDNVRLEICAYETPEVFGSTERRPMMQIGITHFAVSVRDYKAACARIVELGGQVYPETHVSSSHGDLIFCTDPDGVRIELWQKPVKA